ncbi:MAG: hypothetical protein DME17_06430 [Candidatus Rokuibacteriota bacterium]|nr:MAG: hypothetical protein DME17_06430 [Candidatus Rokubacteria bacterium]
MHLTLALLAGALAALGGVGQLDLDCGHARDTRREVGRTRLSEIEQAEDVARVAREQALARCPGGARGAGCRTATRERFEAAWTRQKAAIEARYQALLRDFEARCAGVLARAAPPARLGVQSLLVSDRAGARSREAPCAESSFSESGSSSCESSPIPSPARARS